MPHAQTDCHKLTCLPCGLQTIEKLGEEVSVSETRQKALEKILEHEMKLLNSLKDGKALAQHLEDQYLEALCAVIMDAKPSAELQEAIARVRENVAEYRALLAARAESGGEGKK